MTWVQGNVGRAHGVDRQQAREQIRVPRVENADSVAVPYAQSVQTAGDGSHAVMQCCVGEVAILVRNRDRIRGLLGPVPQPVVGRMLERGSVCRCGRKPIELLLLLRREEFSLLRGLISIHRHRVQRSEVVAADALHSLRAHMVREQLQRGLSIDVFEADIDFQWDLCHREGLGRIDGASFAVDQPRPRQPSGAVEDVEVHEVEKRDKRAAATGASLAQRVEAMTGDGTLGEVGAFDEGTPGGRAGALAKGSRVEKKP